jgi:hypothetical protein
MSDKKSRGQFYTVESDYILDGLDVPPPGSKIIEPFAGKGDLIKHFKNYTIEAWDIDPKYHHVKKRDTLAKPPNYTDAWVITNPPYLARNKCVDKTMFDMYETNDLYKCFIKTLCSTPCLGGILIIPVGFFTSPRDVDSSCRHEFMSMYRITRVKYFEETVFPDTSTTVVAFSFVRSTEPLPMEEQDIEWVRLPSGQSRVFKVSSKDDWIIGGDVYKLKNRTGIKIKRYVEGQENPHLTHLTLTALDSGKKNGRIQLEYKPGYIYKAKTTSRAYATLCVHGYTLSENQQIDIANRFNKFIEQKRQDTWSLFLPQYRESKEYARKRIPFELAYAIILSMI